MTEGSDYLFSGTALVEVFPPFVNYVEGLGYRVRVVILLRLKVTKCWDYSCWCEDWGLGVRIRGVGVRIGDLVLGLAGWS